MKINAHAICMLIILLIVHALVCRVVVRYTTRCMISPSGTGVLSYHLWRLTSKYFFCTWIPPPINIYTYGRAFVTLVRARIARRILNTPQYNCVCYSQLALAVLQFNEKEVAYYGYQETAAEGFKYLF